MQARSNFEDQRGHRPKPNGTFVPCLPTLVLLNEAPKVACYLHSAVKRHVAVSLSGAVCSGQITRIVGRKRVNRFLQLWSDESGQDIAEYAVMLAVILVIVVGTVRLIGSNANMVFSQAASNIH